MKEKAVSHQQGSSAGFPSVGPSLSQGQPSLASAAWIPSSMESRTELTHKWVCPLSSVWEHPEGLTEGAQLSFTSHGTRAGKARVIWKHGEENKDERCLWQKLPVHTYNGSPRCRSKSWGGASSLTNSVQMVIQKTVCMSTARCNLRNTWENAKLLPCIYHWAPCKPG